MNLTGLVSWLKFDKSPTDDFIKKNHWEVFGNPTIGTENAINGNALQLDGQSYIKLSGVELGGANFEIDGWVYVDSTSPNYARLINIVNPSNGEYLMSVYKSPDDSTKLEFWHNLAADASNSAGYTRRSDTVSIGKRVHFKLIYRYSGSTRYIILCVNDKTVASRSNALAYDRQKFDIYIGANPSGSQGLIGSIDELTIYDGTWYSYGYGNVPTADYYNLPVSISADFDTKRKVLNPPLTWRYENYGSADLLTQTGTTITNLDETKSKTGSAFYQPTSAKCFDIPATKEIWLKCDIYTTANYANNDRIRIYSKDSNGVNGWSTNSTINSNYYLWHNGTSQAGANYFAKNKLRSILLHMISDSTNGVVEYFFESGTTDKFTGNVNNGEDFANVYIQMDGSNILVSNLIISNAPLDINEDVSGILTAIEFTADTSRNIKNAVTVSADTERRFLQEIWKQSYPKFDDTTDYFRTIIQIPSTDEVWVKFDIKTGDKETYDLLDEPARFSVRYLSDISNEDDYPSYGLVTFLNQCYWQADTYSSDRIQHDLDYNIKENCLIHLKSGESNGLMEIFFNGVLAGSYTGNINEGNNFDNISYIRTTTYYQIENLIISNAELSENFPVEIYFDTLRIVADRFTEIISQNFDTKRNVTKSLTLNFDTKREITYNQVWRYENYGTADLLTVEGTTAILEKSASKYQSGFYSTANRQNYFDIPATKEVWIKFDFWFTSLYETLFVGSLDNEKTNQVRLNCAGEGTDTYARIIFALSENVVSDITNHFHKEQRYSAVLHLKSDETNGKIDLTVSDGHNLTYTGNVNNGNNFENIYIQASHYNDISTYPLVSNVIISNSEVGINENARMPSISYYDLLRNVYPTFEYQCFFDSNRKVIISKIFNADLCRKIDFAEELDNETCRNVISSEEIDFDIARTMPHDIKVMALTNKTKLAILADSIDSDVVITPTTENTTKGLQKIEINLSAQQLTDQITYTSTLPVNIMEQVNGIYLDYLFNVRIEKIQRQGVLNTCYCCSDIDELLYKQLSYYVPATERKWSSEPLKGGAKLEGHSGKPIKVALATALKHMQRIANVLGKNLLSYFADFTSTLDVLQNGGKTYQDLIREIFGWTSRIPTMLINCFLRDDKLFVVQRGYEPNEIDLTNTKHTMPIISQSLMRTFWSANVWSKTNTKTEYLGFPYSYWVPDDSGSGESGGSSEPTTSPNRVTDVDTKDGLVHGTKIENADGSYTEVTYQYETADNGQVYLVAEIERTYELSKEGSWELIGEQVTTHEPQNTGQSIAHKNDQDGEFIGSSISKAADQRPTEYVDPFRSTKVAHLVDPKMTTTTTIYGITPFDTSFPVAGKEKLIELTDAIKWLNRRTQEKITMTFYDYPHLIDFTDRIIFEGEVYFLESNTVITTHRIINQQTVTFVRWF